MSSEDKKLCEKKIIVICSNNYIERERKKKKKKKKKKTHEAIKMISMWSNRAYLLHALVFMYLKLSIHDSSPMDHPIIKELYGILHSFTPKHQ